MSQHSGGRGWYSWWGQGRQQLRRLGRLKTLICGWEGVSVNIVCITLSFTVCQTEISLCSVNIFISIRKSLFSITNLKIQQMIVITQAVLVE